MPGTTGKRGSSRTKATGAAPDKKPAARSAGKKAAPAVDAPAQGETNGRRKASAAVRECPFCREMIRASAIKCRFCGESLRAARPGASPRSTLRDYAAPVANEIYYADTLARSAWIGPAMLAAAVICCAFVVASVYPGPVPMLLGSLGVFYWICKWVSYRSRTFTITNGGIEYTYGVFSRNIEIIEMAKVEDIVVHQSFFEKLFNLGRLTVMSSDGPSSTITIRPLYGAVDLYHVLKQVAFEAQRRVRVAAPERSRTRPPR
jgi:membrane protein YdbS with pleckstrin-like domain